MKNTEINGSNDSGHDDPVLIVPAKKDFQFAFKQPFDARFIEAVEKLDDYYVWITAIDSFDYQRFDPDWLFNHLTMYYKEQYRSSKSLRNWLRKHLLGSDDARLARLFIDLYTKPG